MSFLTLDQSIAPFSECLISFWFREPNEAVAIAAAAPKIGDPLYPEFDKKIPLVVFGGPRVQQEYVATFPVIATSPNYSFDGSGLFDIIAGTWRITTQSVGLVEGSHYLDPTYIGLNIRDGAFELFINLQLDQFPVIKNWFFAPDGVTDTFLPAGAPFPRGLDQNVYTPSGMKDVSVIQLMRGVPENYSVSVPLTPTEDQWHHVLMSFDLGASVQTTAIDGSFSATFKAAVQKYSKMWLVVDGVSIKMPDVTESTITGQPDDALLSFSQQFIATTPYDSTNPASVGFGKDGIGIPIDPITGLPIGFASVFAGSFTAFKPAPSYKLATPVIAAGAIGIPAMTRFVKSVYRVEMAEYQMWSGSLSSRDVRKPGVLSLFLTDKGKPNLKTKDVTDALGKPKIKLHGSGNWRIGKNTGVFDSNFTPTGRIKQWKPNPSLHGSQDPIRDETN